MYKREFDQLLASGQIPKSLMLYGDNDYFIQRTAEAFIEKTGAGDNLLKLYYDEYDFQNAKNYLGQSSLFGDVNLLVIRSDKKIPKKELTRLIDLAHRNADNYFLYIYTGDDFKSLTGAFGKKVSAEHVRFFPANLKEAVTEMEKEAKNLHLQIDRYALEHLLQLMHFNLAMAVNELKKLAILDGPVGTKEIDENTYSLAPAAMEETLYAIFSKTPLPDILTRIQQSGEDEFETLRSLQYFIVRLFLFHIHIKLHGHPDSAAILGYKLPKQVEERYARLAVRIGLDLFDRLFDILAEGEQLLKTAGPSQRETILFSTLIKIKSFLR